MVTIQYVREPGKAILLTFYYKNFSWEIEFDDIKTPSFWI